MTTIKVAGVTVDISDVTTDGERWRGRVLFAFRSLTATGWWNGTQGSDMGELVDVEGMSEIFCEMIDAHQDEITSAITNVVGDPSDDDDGRAAMFAAIEQERAVREAMVAGGRS